LRTGCFLPGPDGIAVALSTAERSRKQAMFDCFVTQAAMLRSFGADTERFRPAPRYDFDAPPLPGQLNYEHWGWDMTGERWRALARGAMRCGH
ncbi:MAG: PIG-L family deacetylase, partial [Gemmatimonadaceae bacterium]|nr:PIG-L family deacetylase [Acetobacteraceae bacterium]